MSILKNILTVYPETARGHPTGRLRVDCFIKPTLMSLMFLRGDRNGMLPYFFAAGHHNYARYLSWYVRQMEHLPQRAKEDLLASEHVCLHLDGGTAVPADQFGEQTYINRGKGSGGMRGQVAPYTVNVQNALAIGSEQSRQFSASLSSEFHKTINGVA